MDCIIEIEGIEFYAYHGCFKEEQIVGNKFLVDIAIKVNNTIACKTDNINDALNYQHVYDIIKEEIGKKSHLLENVAGRIVEILYQKFSMISNIKIKISKINPPLGGQVNKVSITLSR